ncbi:MAG: NYN domain-containing protein [Deltaproteobacteria bacterium]|nr:NYN domain-containing protein [Deltaproteobacteria bacterium]
MVSERKCAMFVDFENAYLGYVDFYGNGNKALDNLLDTLKQIIKRHGGESQNLLIKRAYADWEKLHEKSDSDFQRPLAFMGIKPSYVMSSYRKNSTDIVLSLAVQEVLLTKEDFTDFIIIGGDRDYMPIVDILKENGKAVTVYGSKDSTAGDLIEIVGEANFFYLQDVLSQSGETAGDTGAETQSTADALQNNVRERSRGALHRRSLLPEHLTEANFGKTVRLIQDAGKNYSSEEIWLGPFYRKYMNEAFANLSDEQRKEIIAQLEHDGIITVTNTGSRSILRLNREHPKARRLMEQMADRK